MLQGCAVLISIYMIYLWLAGYMFDTTLFAKDACSKQKLLAT